MAEVIPLTILHLSDLQFGRNHRYLEGERSLDCLYAKLAEDLEGLAAESELRPGVLVVSGDVAEWSLPAEYAAAQGFLEKLTAKLAIPRQQVVIVPGNHDVNRKLCAGARLMAEGGGEPFNEPFFAKFGNYQRFFNRFFEDAGLLFAEDRLFHVVSLPENDSRAFAPKGLDKSAQGKATRAERASPSPWVGGQHSELAL